MAATHQQSASNFSLSAGTTLAQAFGSNTAPGNLLLAWAAWASTTATCALTDLQGNIWTPIAGSLCTFATPGMRTQLFIAKASGATTNSVTMTTSASVAERDLVISEFSGSVGWPASPADQSNQASGTGANPTSTVNSTAAGELAYAGAWDSAGTITAGSGYTLAAGPNGNGAEYKLSTSSGSNSVPFVDATSGNWLISEATAAEAAAVGADPAAQPLLFLLAPSIPGMGPPLFPSQVAADDAVTVPTFSSTVSVSARASAAITAQKVVSSTMAVTAKASTAITGRKSVSSTVTAAARVSAAITGARSVSTTFTASARASAAITGRRSVSTTFTATARASALFTGQKSVSMTLGTVCRASVLIAGRKSASGAISVSARASALITGTATISHSSTMAVGARASFIATAKKTGLGTFGPSARAATLFTARKTASGVLSVTVRGAVVITSSRRSSSSMTVAARVTVTITALAGAVPQLAATPAPTAVGPRIGGSRAPSVGGTSSPSVGPPRSPQVGQSSSSSTGPARWTGVTP